MGFLCVWTITAVSYQTAICILVSWLTLSCRLQPHPQELHEITLMKLLYFYDPETCDKVYAYNCTIRYGRGFSSSPIIWPKKNYIAASFRYKLQVWTTLHAMWAFFCLAYMLQGHQSCGFYATLIPFTFAGTALLCVDIIYAVLFTLDAFNTPNEVALLNYISGKEQTINVMSGTDTSKLAADCSEDTTWVGLLFAYASLRGVVQWIANFWIIKDNFIEGCRIYNRSTNSRGKTQMSS